MHSAMLKTLFGRLIRRLSTVKSKSNRDQKEDSELNVHDSMNINWEEFRNFLNFIGFLNPEIAKCFLH